VSYPGYDKCHIGCKKRKNDYRRVIAFVYVFFLKVNKKAIPSLKWINFLYYFSIFENLLIKKRIDQSDQCVDSLCMERVMGIEPTTSAWKAEVLPLNYTRR
jgi:hypothetical protein